MNEEYTLGLVVPCYNEQKKLDVKSYIEYLKNNKNVILCFINDGSQDGTTSIIQQISRSVKNVLIIDSERNHGKGEAVRTGILFLMEQYDVPYLAFLDADLSAPFSELNRLLSIIENDRNLHFLFGSRVLVFGKLIQRSPLRHYLGRIMATTISISLHLAIYDTQCGLKLFKREAANLAFKAPFISRWLFDVEIIERIKESVTISELFYVMKEEPLLEWTEFGDTKIKIKDIFIIPLDLLLIKLKHKRMAKYKYSAFRCSSS